MKKRGVFIVLEGIDGAGTTTHARLLVERLASLEFPYLATAEPSSLVLGRVLRRALREKHILSDPSLALLFAADRLEHWAQEIEPALLRGEIVVCDRYLLSSLAYQSLSNSLDWVATLNQHARRPDLTVFLDVSPAVAEQRRRKRDGPVERFDATETQRKVCEMYRRCIGRDDVGPVWAYDGDGSIGEIHEAIWGVVEPLFSAESL